MKKKIFLFVLCSLIPCLLLADPNENAVLHEVTGRVVDERGSPLSGASVLVVGTTIEAGTNARGEFLLKLREGKFTLRIGYTGRVRQDVVVEVPQRQPLTVRLEPALNDLEEVVVTGNRLETPLKNVPVLTRMISRTQIEKLNAMNLQTVLEYELPGIQFGRHHGTGLPTLTFQGVDGNYVLFLVDGERVGGEGADNNIDFDRFNIDDIERVEVIQGAMSTLYGSNALGGVVNIITKKANRPLMGNLSAQYSNRDTRKYSASIGSRLNRFSTLTSVSYREKEPFTLEDRGTETDGTVKTTSVLGYEIFQASQKFTYAFTDRFSAEAGGTYYDNRVLTTNAAAKTQDLFGSLTLNGKLNYILTQGHRLDLTWHMDDFRRYKDYLLLDRKEKLADNLAHTFRLGYTGRMSVNSSIVAGAELDLENLTHFMFADTSKQKVNSYVLYIQEERKVTDRFSLVTGIRADIHSRYGLHVTPKVSALYRLKEFTFRGGYASGFRSPSLKELYSEWSHQGMFWLIGNPDLKPETSHQLSLSAEYNRGIFNASVSGYYNEFQDKIILLDAVMNPETERPEVGHANADEARTVGLNATAQLRFSQGFTLRGAYAYIDDRAEIEGYNRSQVRPHSITFNTDYSWRMGRLRASAGVYGRWMSGVNYWSKNDSGFYSTRYHSRTICSANASVQFPRGIRLNLGVENLFNFKDKNLSSDTSISPQRGITFIGSVSINLADLFKL